MTGSEPGGPGALPTVTVIIPCRREADVIGRVLDSLLRTDYQRDRLEVLVIDGMSDDGTREIVAGVAAREPRVRMVDNPKRVIPAAMNVGIAMASGEVIVRMDAHTTYPADYIRRCVEGLLSTGADNVGGPCVTIPREPTLLALAFATVLSHPFGVGNAHYKLGISEPLEVDAVPFGCMWRRKMLEIGPYEERIARSEDFGFNARLRARGGRLMLLPGITSFYYARSRLGPFIKHSFSNGHWVSYPLAFGDFPASWRHYVPLIFVLGLTIPTWIGLYWPAAMWVSGSGAAAYGLAAIVAGIHGARRTAKPALALLLPPIFLLLHLTYGIGTAVGLVRAGWHRLIASARPRPDGADARGV